jgi:hypothetical protein
MIITLTIFVDYGMENFDIIYKNLLSLITPEDTVYIHFNYLPESAYLAKIYTKKINEVNSNIMAQWQQNIGFRWLISHIFDASVLNENLLVLNDDILLELNWRNCLNNIPEKCGLINFRNNKTKKEEEFSLIPYDKGHCWLLTKDGAKALQESVSISDNIIYKYGTKFGPYDVLISSYLALQGLNTYRYNQTSYIELPRINQNYEKVRSTLLNDWLIMEEKIGPIKKQLKEKYPDYWTTPPDFSKCTPK